MLKSACPSSATLVLWRVVPFLDRIIRTTRSFSQVAEEEVVSHSTHDSASTSSSCSVESPFLSDSSDESEESSSWALAPQVLQAYLRSRRARCVARVREQGRIPAVLVDGDKSRRPKDGSTDLFLSLEAKPITALLKLIGKRDFVSRVFDMDIFRNPESQEIKERLQVLPRNLNYGPGKTNILNIQFIRAAPGQALKLGVPLEYLGADRCPGLKKGGTLMKLAKYVVYNCKATEVPAKIVVDMTVLEIGDRVQVQDLEVDFDLLHSDRTTPVCEIVKDAATLKAKAKRLKNELFFKKKALADKEDRAKNPVQSQSLSEDEVDAEEEDELQHEQEPTERVQRHRGLRKSAFKESIVKKLPKGSVYEKQKVVDRSARAKNVPAKLWSASDLEDEELPSLHTRKGAVGLRKSGTEGSSGRHESNILAKSQFASDVEVAERDEESLPVYTKKLPIGLRRSRTRGSSGSGESNLPANSRSASNVEDEEPTPMYTRKRAVGLRKSDTRDSSRSRSFSDVLFTEVDEEPPPMYTRKSGTRGSSGSAYARKQAVGIRKSGTGITELDISAKSPSAEEDEKPRLKYTRERAGGTRKFGTADKSLKRCKPSERRLVGSLLASNKTEQAGETKSHLMLEVLKSKGGAETK